MKLLKTLYAGLALLGGFGALTSCQDDMDNPGLEVPQATMKANTTIAELKEAMWQNDANYAIKCPEKDNGEHYIIKGRVISSDASGNVYKSMYIQDETEAITLSINQNSLYNQYRLGQEVVIDVTGLYIGKYAGLEQIGGYGEYNGTPQVSFMIYPLFVDHTELNGMPEPVTTTINYGDQAPESGIYAVRIGIDQLPAETDYAAVRYLQSQLIELNNVHFEEGGKNTFSTYQQTENRNLVDEKGNTIIVRTSGYSTFYSQTLPEGSGTVRGLLSYFNGTWQLILRSTGDILFDDKGQKDSPYTIDEALNLMNTGTSAWVEGYIVGAVNGGVTSVTSNSDITWGYDVDIDNNVVIGVTPDTKDFTQCIVVELPSGSDLRKAVNLLDNPGNYLKRLAVRGTFQSLLGIGAVQSSGKEADFDLEGYQGGSGDTPTVSKGTWDNPYTITDVLGGQAGSEIWITGYIVGWVDTNISNKYDASTCTFTTPATVATNVMMAATANETNYSNCVPVQLPYGDVRTKLNLVDNPSNLGRQITVKGNAETYFSVKGIKSVTEYNWGALGTNPNGGSGDNPSTSVNDGSEEHPFTVAEIIAGTASGTGVWAEGWYVGTVSGKTWADGATFSGTPGSEYTNTNFILGPTADCKSIDLSIPVQIPAGALRDVLGLGNNPSIYLKHIKVKGNVEKYFGVPAFKSVTEYKEIN